MKKQKLSDTLNSVKGVMKERVQPELNSPCLSLNTGSTLLNLALTDKPHGGFLAGRYYFMVGDSASGKTFLSMTCFAEASHNPDFQNHRLIYDDVEGGCLMELERLFGSETADRVEPPRRDENDEPVFSSSVEDFYYHVDDAIKEGRPFIYVLDSMDALTSDSEIEKFEEGKKAARAGKEVAGSYGDGKAKKNSSSLRRITNALRGTKSILIVISQTRDNLGFGFNKKSRSGGHALRFYATCEIWTSVKEKIKKTVMEKDRHIGNLIRVKVEKNRTTGKCPEVDVMIFPSYGMDDIQSCIEYLRGEGHWTKKGPLVAPEFDFKGSVSGLIKKIEEESGEAQLKELVAKVWKEIEDNCALKRKPRYD